MSKINEQRLSQIITEIIEKLVSKGISINDMEYVLEQTNYRIKDLIPLSNINN